MLPRAAAVYPAEQFVHGESKDRMSLRRSASALNFPNSHDVHMLVIVILNLPAPHAVKLVPPDPSEPPPPLLPPPLSSSLSSPLLPPPLLPPPLLPPHAPSTPHTAPDTTPAAAATATPPPTMAFEYTNE